MYPTFTYVKNKTKKNQRLSSLAVEYFFVFLHCKYISIIIKNNELI